jgi:hypothetical protein
MGINLRPATSGGQNLSFPNWPFTNHSRVQKNHFRKNRS